MGNPLSDYMGNWLNKTYAYLKETRGAVRPPVTVGPGVLPTGPYSLIDDPPGVYYTTGGTAIKYNPADTGLSSLIPNKIDTSIEIAKENPAPEVVANGFQLLYGEVGMKGCISDQKDGQGNPDAQKACSDFALTGDTSLMILFPSQKELLGILPAEEKDKSDDVRGAEDDLTLTNQITQGGKELVDAINNLLTGAGGRDEGEIPDAGGAEGEGKGEGGFFQSVEKGITDILAGVPGMPGTSAIPWNMILVGGGVVLLLLVITR